MENAHEDGSNLETRLFRMARHGTRRTTITVMLRRCVRAEGQEQDHNCASSPSAARQERPRSGTGSPSRSTAQQLRACTSPREERTG